MTQVDYNTSMRAGVPGMVANMHGPYEADTRIVETPDGIGFGLAVSQGAADKGAVIGGDAFVGISIRDVTLVANAGEAVDTYLENTNMSVMTKGDMWVTANGAVAAGNDVTYDTTTGRLGTAAVGAGVVAIPGARWQSSAADGGLAVVRLAGQSVTT